MVAYRVARFAEASYYLVLVASVFLLLCTLGKASVLTVGPGGEYPLIQMAVEAAKPGDVVLVEGGVYYENVNVTKGITLRGVGVEGEVPVVSARGPGSAITLAADGITLEGFHATGSSGPGIEILSSGNVVRNNSASENQIGIGLFNSSRNVLRNNRLYENWMNFEVLFLEEGDFENDIDSTNLVDNRSIYYLTGVRDKTYDSSTNAGTFYCIDCQNVTLRDLNLTGNVLGVLLENNTGSIVEGNRIRENKVGVWIWDSDNVTVRGNVIEDNERSGVFLGYIADSNVAGNDLRGNGYGIFLMASANNSIFDNMIDRSEEGVYMVYGSLNNTVRGNEFVNCERAVRLTGSKENVIYLNNFPGAALGSSVSCTNFWNSTGPLTYVFENESFTNRTGNYWGGRQIRDSNEDGLGDQPLITEFGVDCCPLQRPFQEYHVVEGQ